MVTTYILKAKDLSDEFIAGVKKSYKNKKIEIIIHEIDETEYLLKTPANRRKLMKAIKNVEARRNLIEVRLKDMKKNR